MLYARVSQHWKKGCNAKQISYTERGMLNLSFFMWLLYNKTDVLRVRQRKWNIY